jgi:hypothetical protein
LARIDRRFACEHWVFELDDPGCSVAAWSEFGDTFELKTCSGPDRRRSYAKS